MPGLRRKRQRVKYLKTNSRRACVCGGLETRILLWGLLVLFRSEKSKVCWQTIQLSNGKRRERFRCVDLADPVSSLSSATAIEQATFQSWQS